MVKDKESGSGANSDRAVRGKLRPAARERTQQDRGGCSSAILPGNGLPVALHSSSVGNPDRMVWLMISPEEGMLGGSEGHTQYYTQGQQFG